MLDFDDAEDKVGELTRPVASEASAIYRKAAYIINTRKLIADEIARLDDIASESGLQDVGIVYKHLGAQIEELSRHERMMVERETGLSWR